MVQLLLANQARPIIIVDWSPLGQGTEYQLLRATIPAGGRALTLYESCHLEHQLANRKIHQEFLGSVPKVFLQYLNLNLSTDFSVYFDLPPLPR